MSNFRVLVPKFVRHITASLSAHERLNLHEDSGLVQEISDHQMILKTEGYTPEDFTQFSVSIMFEPVNWHLQRRTGTPTKHGVEPTIHVVMTKIGPEGVEVEDFYYFPTAGFQLELASTSKWIRSSPSDVADDIVNFLLFGKLPQQ